MDQRPPDTRPPRDPNDRNQNRPEGGRPDAGRPDAGRPDGQRHRGDGPREFRHQQRNHGSRHGGPREGGPREGDPRQGSPREGEPLQGEQRTNEQRSNGSRNDRRQDDRRSREGGPREDNRDGGPRDATFRSVEERSVSPRDAGPRDGQPELTEPTERIVVGITLGDYNGVGPEVILKALKNGQLQRFCTPVIYGSLRVLNRYKTLLDLKDWNLNGIQHIGQASHKMTNVITCWNDASGGPNGQPVEVEPGKSTSDAGRAALACLQRAVEDLKAGKLHALVTAPISKHNIQSEEFKFPGHTEFLAEAFGANHELMFMVSETLRVGVVTGHIPVNAISQHLTQERITAKLAQMLGSLREDFGIVKPKIAVLGLNPHAGEGGLLGPEDDAVIAPALETLRSKGELVFGPFPADGFFGTRQYRHYDAVLAMYHDQGLIPFKTIAFDEGVNFTAGLPIVRTSPDHGTAYDIAGKGVADETSMLHAIYTAVNVARRRKEYQEIKANALK